MTRESGALAVDDEAGRSRVPSVRRARLTSAQVESAVRAAARGGVRVLRVTVDHERGRIEIEAATDDAPPPRSFDTIDFRAAP